MLAIQSITGTSGDWAIECSDYVACINNPLLPEFNLSSNSLRSSPPVLRCNVLRILNVHVPWLQIGSLHGTEISLLPCAQRSWSLIMWMQINPLMSYSRFCSCLIGISKSLFDYPRTDINVRFEPYRSPAEVDFENRILMVEKMGPS